MHNGTRGLIFAIFVVGMFLLSPMNQVVSAEVVPISKTVNIEADSNADYEALLNLVNNSNIKYTNEELLISAFEDKTGVTGMISGSFLPPAKFQLGSAVVNGFTTNTNLVLASTVQFQKKNLLSGASSSWWRCPYYFNTSIPGTRDFSVRLSIYHTDLPRTTNLTSTIADGYNWINNKAPQQMAHPSLVYEQVYYNCGNIANTNQTFVNVNNTMPVNDTLVDPDLPLNLTALPGDPEYNPYKYYTRIEYAHAWFNVSAPIYPNSTYFVVWDIYDADTTQYYPASFWVTATDIGQDEYGRCLVAWNGVVYNGTDVWEFPIDLDISVVFQTGMGAGVSGTELIYNDNANMIDHRAGIAPSISEYSFEYQWPAPTWQPYTSSFEFWTPSLPLPALGYIQHNLITPGVDDTTNFIFNATGCLYGGGGGIDGHSQDVYSEIHVDMGIMPEQNINFDIGLYGVETYISPTESDYGSQIKIGLHGGASGELASVIIQKYQHVHNGVSIFGNYVIWHTSVDTYGYVSALPDIMPNDMYVTIQTIAGGDVILVIYDQNNPNEIWWWGDLYLPYHGVCSMTGYSITACVYAGAVVPGTSIVGTGEIAASIRKLAGTDRTGYMAPWTIEPTSTALPSKVFWADGFETQVPNMRFVPNYPFTWQWNVQAFSFTQYHPSQTFGNVYQYSTVAVSPPPTPREYFVEANYRIIQDALASSYPYQSSFRLILYGVDSLGVYSYVETYYYLNDGSWHSVSTGHLVGRFVRLIVNCAFYFPYRVGLRQGFVDNILVYSVEQPMKYQLFSQELDKTGWNATNYYTLMIPFRMDASFGTPSMSPYALLIFYSSAGAWTYQVYTMPTDFNNDFIIWGIPTSLIPVNAAYVDIYLFVFDPGMYLFLHDRNQDYTVNSATETKYNMFQEYHYQWNGWSYVTTLLTYKHFSPYYSLKTTEGQWINADSAFTTTYFYYVVVHFVRFNGNDPEIISICIDSVDVSNIEAYRLKLTTFGPVYDAKEWVSYLEYMNRPSLLDKIIDAFARLFTWLLENTWLGQLLLAIGKFIFDIIEFLVPLLESLAAYILEAIVFIAAVVIFIIATWVMWNFVRFWILVGQNRVEEGLEVLGNMSAKVQAGIQSVASGVTGVVKKIGTGGVG